MGGACNVYEKDEKCILNFGWKPEGRRLLGKPRHIWEDIIKMNLEKIELS
jgi:hypothetical protein